MIISTRKTASVDPIIGTVEGVVYSKRWYVALVKMHHERKVVEYLTKLGIESFVPIQQETHQWSDRCKLVESVLLPMMVFVYADQKEKTEILTLSTVNRYMVLRGEKNPAVIPDEQITRFRFILDYSDKSVCMSANLLARGEKVRVVKGPLAGLEGEFITIEGRSQIAIRLNMLGCACVEIPVSYIESIQ